MQGKLLVSAAALARRWGCRYAQALLYRWLILQGAVKCIIAVALSVWLACSLAAWLSGLDNVLNAHYMLYSVNRNGFIAWLSSLVITACNQLFICY